MADLSNIKPIKLYWRPGTPNPAKVIIILEELQIPYQGEFIEMADLKKPVFESVNPNGRVPAIFDPNTNITLWESNAIVTYLVETYDKANKLNYTSSPEKWELCQWEYFQASGQGPYFGQAAWFLVFHSEAVQSAKDRYMNEVRRVVGVLDRVLKDRAGSKDQDGNVWLVGNKCTYVDLSFVNWNGAISWFTGEGRRPKEDWEPEKEFPHFWKWHTAMASRPSFAKSMSVQKAEDVHL